MARNLVAVLGSPRKNGNTDILLENALKPARDKKFSIKKIALNELNIRPCQECGGCLKTGICRINDDMAVLHKAFNAATRIIVASPIFFGSISAQTKIMVDRMQCAWVRKYVLGKTGKRGRKGFFIACGAFKKDNFFKCAEKIIDIFFKVQDIEFSGKLFAKGIDSKRAVLNHPKILDKACKMGEQLIK